LHLAATAAQLNRFDWNLRIAGDFVRRTRANAAAFLFLSGKLLFLSETLLFLLLIGEKCVIIFYII
jgi:hypothetical protein